MHGLGVDQTLITQSCALPHVVGHVGGVHACVITHVDASGHGAQPLEAADTMYRVAVCIPCVVLPAMLHEGMHGPKPLHGLITHTQGVVGASVVGDWVVGDCVYVGIGVYVEGVVGACVYTGVVGHVGGP